VVIAPTAVTAVPVAADDAGVLHRAREIGTGGLVTRVLHCGGWPCFGRRWITRPSQHHGTFRRRRRALAHRLVACAI